MKQVLFYEDKVGLPAESQAEFQRVADACYAHLLHVALRLRKSGQRLNDMIGLVAWSAAGETVSVLTRASVPPAIIGFANVSPAALEFVSNALKTEAREHELVVVVSTLTGGHHRIWSTSFEFLVP